MPVRIQKGGDSNTNNSNIKMIEPSAKSPMELFQLYLLVLVIFYFGFYIITKVFEIPYLFVPNYPQSPSVMDTADFYQKMRTFLSAQFPNLPIVPTTNAQNGELKDTLYVNQFSPNVETQKFFYYLLLFTFLFFVANYFKRTSFYYLFKSPIFWMGGFLGILFVFQYYYKTYSGTSGAISFEIKQDGSYDFNIPFRIWFGGIAILLLVIGPQFMFTQNKMYYMLYTLVILVCIFTVFIFQPPFTNIRDVTQKQNVLYGPSFLFSLPLFLYVCLLLWISDWNRPELEVVENGFFGFLFVSCLSAYFLRGLELFSVEKKTPCLNETECIEKVNAASKFQMAIQAFMLTVLILLVIFLFAAKRS